MAAPNPEPGTQVATRKTPQQVKLSNIQHRLERQQFGESLAAVLPKYVTPERMVRVALLALNRQPALLDCTPESIAEAILTIATWGLEVGRTAHMVPYGSQAQAQIDWKGMVELAIRAEIITSCTPRLVFEKDEFGVEYGDKQFIHHVPSWRDDPGEKVGVYAVVRYPSGATDFELMSRRQVERIRDTKSKAWKRERGKRGPWESDEDEMWKKTVVRLLLKRVPQPPMLATALDADEEAERRDSAAELLAAHAEARQRNRHRDVRTDDGVYEGEPRNTLAGEARGLPVETVDMANKPPVHSGNAEGPYSDDDTAPLSPEEAAEMERRRDADLLDEEARQTGKRGR